MVHRSIAKANKDSGTLDAIARGLGWFSIALGVAELLAPRQVTRTLGYENGARVAQFYGLREIAAGIGLLWSRDPTPWMWGRVAGDALDLASLVPALRHDNPQRGQAGLALGAVAAVTLLDLCCASQLHTAKGGRFGRTIRSVEESARAAAGHAVDLGQDTADRAKAAAQDAVAGGRRAAHDARDRIRDATRH